ncbi:oxidoreductase [Lithospermum erythrorhizon]|uniref:Oxidoreductase n=1 Tax=Lithospermum erythrorhizon TaxID=34254 RepID=A0AAV3PK99_LITER
MVGAGKKISYSEVSSHNTPNDCWVIINAKAYNVTNFLSEHPGGDEVLLAAAGMDASDEFEDAGHGSAARLMLDEFYVGEIDQTTSPTKLTKNDPIKQHSNEQRMSTLVTVKLLLYIAPFAILGIASLYSL